jgi:hypothetical protein
MNYAASDFQVAVPSHNRVDVLPIKTLALLLDGGVNPRRITVFVADEAERELYEAVVGDCRLVAGRLGLREQLNFIHTWYPEGLPVVKIDDDVTAIEELTPDGKLAPVHCIPSVFQEAFALADKVGARLWGTYPVYNAFFMRPTVTTDLRFCIGHLCGYRIDPAVQLGAPHKTDYETTLRYWDADHAVLRMNHLVAKTRYRAKGGLDGIRTPEAEEQSVEYLVEHWPQHVRPWRRKDGRPEVKLR